MGSCALPFSSVDYIAAIRGALAGRPPRELAAAGARLAAVLVLLYRVRCEDHVVLTRRTERVEYHKGQISLPGGVQDPEDAGPVETALRECREEIGVHPQAVEVLGRLDDVVTTTGFRITPVVGVLRESPYPFSPSPDEVAEILEVPIGWLAEPANLSVRTREWKGRIYTDYAWNFRGRLIWGATGRILKALIELLPAPVRPG